MITISNDGPAIVSTNYWQSEHARRGFLYVSGNAGVLRLLVPQVSEPAMIPEMKTAKSVLIEPSVRNSKCWDIVFDDGTKAPFTLSIDKTMFERAVEPGDCSMTVWTQEGLVMTRPCSIRPG